MSETDSTVELASYDPRWPGIFEAEQEGLISRFGGEVREIQHIGSTAIPGMAAKPIVDVMVGVERLAVDDKVIGLLKDFGYEYFGEYGIPGRHFFRKGAPRTHHLHWVLWGGDFWRRQVDFRDYMLTFPEEAQRYERLKRELAAHFSSDRDGYTRAKTYFVQDILEKAAWWKSGRLPSP